MKYLTVDIGSTFTKLHLLDAKNLKILGSANSFTTVDTDVRYGYNKALMKLREQTKDDYDIILGCSSASGGLKVVVVGFSENLTTKAARLASLSSGARILGSFFYKLKDEDLEEIKKLNPDIIVLSGGTNRGNKDNIIYNADRLKNFKIPIVVCGNVAANEEIENIFRNSNTKYEITENVMPKTGHINYIPLRTKISDIFIKEIAKAKGIEKLSKSFKEFIPTPISVQKAISNYVKFKKEDTMSIDIGGATTDIHSICKSYSGEENIISPLIDEPYEKRTVEGDMGMRYSALAIYESVGNEEFLKYNVVNAYEKCKYRFLHPDYLPDTKEEIYFDKVLAKIAVKTSLKRHIGYLKEERTKNRYIYRQFGKDLRSVKNFIATGGVLINSKDAKEILEEINIIDDKFLKPKNLKYFLDEEYILSACGLMALVDEEVSYKIIEKYIKKI